MDLSSTSCAKEVVDLYELINLKIQETGFSSEKLKYIAMAGGNIRATELMKLNKELILNHWQAFIELAAKTHNQSFLHIFLSGMRKLAPDKTKDELVEFLTNHDREIEKEFTREIEQIHTKPATRAELDVIMNRYIQRRSCLHNAAQAQLGVKLKFKHHAQGD